MTATHTKRRQQTVLVGYELGTGDPVSVPLAHTFVTGQTQLSGKTTLLNAIAARSGYRTLAFLTKRGEQFDGRRIKPFLPREGDRPIHWRFVEQILASALGQRSMKYERFWLVNASKGARSLEEVRANVERLKNKIKRDDRSKQAYELIGEYIDLVLPEMNELDASDKLDLHVGANVMDLVGRSQQLQEIVIRASLLEIHQHHEGVLTIFPEAWKFAPRGRITPSSAAAALLAREGAVLHNFLLCDSQDIAGVDTQIRQGSSVWALGVQRELNELRRALRMIPGSIQKPKAADVTSLKIGQFILCWSDSVARVYVRPVWMDEATAIAIAKGELSVDDATHTETIPAPTSAPATPRRSSPPAQPLVPDDGDDEMSAEDVKAIRSDIGELTRSIGTLVKSIKPGAQLPAAPAAGDDDDRPAQKANNAPATMTLNTSEPALTVNVTTRNLEEDENSARGRVAMLIAQGFFAEPKIGNEAYKWWKARGFNQPSTRIYEALASLTKDGFLIMSAKKSYQQHPNLVVNKNGQKKVTLTINYK